MAHERWHFKTSVQRDFHSEAECRLLRSEARDASGYVELFRRLARQPHEDLAAERVRAKVLAASNGRPRNDFTGFYKRRPSVRLAFRGSDDIVRRQREAV